MALVIGITGGKGGTGKSTVAAAVSSMLSKESKVLLVDADVDCPDDHLLLGIERNHLKDVNQRVPCFDDSKCTKCGKCSEACKSNAIFILKQKRAVFMKNQCNGCGACRLVCPENAISWSSKKAGRIYSGKKGNLDLLSGDLEPNEPVSEFIVNALNDIIIKEKENYDYIIIDTAAGTHCPVIAALESCDKVFAVSEPTPLGSHDLEIMLNLLDKLGKKCSIVLNRSDLGNKDLIISLSKKYSSEIICEIPYSREIVDAYAGGRPVDNNQIKIVVEEIKR